MIWIYYSLKNETTERKRKFANTEEALRFTERLFKRGGSVEWAHTPSECDYIGRMVSLRLKYPKFPNGFQVIGKTNV